MVACVEIESLVVIYIYVHTHTHTHIYIVMSYPIFPPGTQHSFIQHPLCARDYVSILWAYLEMSLSSPYSVVWIPNSIYLWVLHWRGMYHTFWLLRVYLCSPSWFSHGQSHPFISF